MRCSSGSLLPGLLIGVVVLWSTALVAAPYSLRHGADGAARNGGPAVHPAAGAVHPAAEPVHAAAGIVHFAAGAVYLVAGAVCHQQPARSFHPWGVQLPVCGRCAGLYGGALLGLLALFGAPRPLGRPTVRLVLGAAAFPTAATVALEAAGLLDPGNAARAASAVPLGAAASGFVAAAIRGRVD